jgi:hypothetical protein
MGDPSTITGLVWWFKSDTGVFQDLAKTIPAANGSGVVVWSDLSGNAYDFISGFPLTVHDQPIFDANVVNGLPAVRFDTTYDSLRFLGNTTPALAQPYSFLFILEPTKLQGSNLTPLWHKTGGGVELWVEGTMNAGLFVGPTASPILNSWNFYLAEFNGFNSFVEIDGVTPGQVFAGNAGFANSEIGNFDSIFDNFSYRVAECALFDHALSPAEITSLYTYFIGRYATNVLKGGQGISQSGSSAALANRGVYPPPGGVNDFNTWQFGVPFISIGGDQEFNQWSAARMPDGSGTVPIVDIDESVGASAFGLLSISTSSAVLQRFAGAAAQGLSVSGQSALLTGLGLLAGKAWSISTSSVAEQGTGALAALCNSITMSRALLSQFSPVLPTTIFKVSASQPITRMQDYGLKFWQRRVSARQPTVRMP